MKYGAHWTYLYFGGRVSANLHLGFTEGYWLGMRLMHISSIKILQLWFVLHWSMHLSPDSVAWGRHCTRHIFTLCLWCCPIFWEGKTECERPGFSVTCACFTPVLLHVSMELCCIALVIGRKLCLQQMQRSGLMKSIMTFWKDSHNCSNCNYFNR